MTANRLGKNGNGLASFTLFMIISSRNHTLFNINLRIVNIGEYSRGP